MSSNIIMFFTAHHITIQTSYGEGPHYFRLKTAIFPVSVFLLLFGKKFGIELENYQYDSFK